MRQSARGASVGLVALTAISSCFTDSGLVAGDSTTSSATAGATDDPAGTTDPTTGPSTMCGDLQVQEGEQCDLGAENSDAGICTAKCLINVCGDAAKSSSEGCDDGNLQDGDGCSATCDAESCGDGQVQANEECDDANAVEDDGCTSLCRPPFCGDGFVQASAGEQCDAGGGNSNAGECLLSCKAAACGDGLLGPGEACDDGNLQSGDGCSPDCQIEATNCGNGVIETGEQCDDGNASNGDACLATCQNAVCGDGFVRVGFEECDDGDDDDTDGCSASCQLQGDVVCGDKQVGPGEECDDGNAQNGDGCSVACAKERRRVFVTKTLFTGALGGLNGAHNKCQMAAASAGLPGTFRAWISNAQDSPAQSFVKSTVPYVRVDGVEVAKNWADLVDGVLVAPIATTETGDAPPVGMHGCFPQVEPLVWSNTNTKGEPVDLKGDCGGWTGVDEGKGSFWGRASAADSSWTYWCSGGNCNFQAALYCFEQ